MNLPVDELHKALVEHASDIISLHELNGTYVFCSPYCIEITGYKPSELIGKSPYEFIHPDDIDKVKELQKSIQKTDSPAFVDYRFKSKSGNFVWLQTSFRVKELSGNGNKVIVATTRDFIERKELEENLLKNQQLLKQMGKISKVGGWLFEIDTQKQHWTEETFNIHEVDYDFVPDVEKGIEFFLGESKTKIAEAVQRAVDYGESYDLELEIMTAKGNIRHVRTMGKADLENRRVYGAIQDITERKHLQEAQLRSTQLSALGELAAGVAHEINNPINGVINYAQLLLNNKDINGQSRKFLERIVREGTRISNIVKSLLNFARKEKHEFTILSINEVLVEPLNLMTQMFKNENIIIEQNILEDLPPIYGNRMQLEQIVLNLLSNARYALIKKQSNPSDEKVIVIDATLSKNEHDQSVVLTVKDFGCGIPREDLNKIFNPFFTTKESGAGTGLGLSVCHEILEKHNATIDVHSKVDKYTVVTITFPVKSW